MKKIRNILKIVIVVISAIVITYSIYFYFFYNHFYSLESELGNPLPTLSYFVKNAKEIDDCELLTDLSSIDIYKEGNYDVYLKYKNKKQKVTLSIKDTTAPDVTFKNHIASKDYCFNIDDFVENINDMSNTTVTHSFDTNVVLDYRDYTFLVSVVDDYDNKTEQEVTLSITPIINQYSLEYGQEFVVDNVVMNKSLDNLIDSYQVERINQGKVGDTFIINVNIESKTFKCVVSIVDTTAPELILKDIKVYVDDVPNYKMEDFIETCNDFSGIKDVVLLSKIDNNIIGTQEIVIKAIDIYGNEVTKSCEYQIKTDDEGPKFSGLDDVVLNKDDEYDFDKDVFAYDEGDREYASFSYDLSTLDTSKAGDYYIEYYAIDKSMNKATAYRKVTINPDQEDEDRLFNEFYDSYLKGKKVEEMANIIQTKIKYNNEYGGDYPVYYGLTMYKGNCYVHAMLLKKACDTAGFENILVNNVSKKHYWNMAKVDGIWRHYESTPGWLNNGPMTDKERKESTSINGDSLTWDNSIYPECN